MFVPSFVTLEFVTTGASVEGVVAVVVTSVVSGAIVVTCVVSGAVVVGASVVSEAYTPCDVKSAKRTALDVMNFFFIFFNLLLCLFFISCLRKMVLVKYLNHLLFQ